MDKHFAIRDTGGGSGEQCKAADAFEHVALLWWKLSFVAADGGQLRFHRIADVDSEMARVTGQDRIWFEGQPEIQLSGNVMRWQTVEVRVPFTQSRVKHR